MGVSAFVLGIALGPNDEEASQLAPYEPGGRRFESVREQRAIYINELHRGRAILNP